MRRTGCAICSGKADLTREIVNQRINDRGYVMVGEYTTGRVKTEFSAGEHIWSASPQNVMKGHGCPHCKGGVGFKADAPGVVYFLRLESPTGTAFKVGISNYSKQKPRQRWRRVDNSTG
jgi:hypothetical protein